MCRLIVWPTFQTKACSFVLKCSVCDNSLGTFLTYWYILFGGGGGVKILSRHFGSMKVGKIYQMNHERAKRIKTSLRLGVLLQNYNKHKQKRS